MNFKQPAIQSKVECTRLTGPNLYASIWSTSSTIRKGAFLKGMKQLIQQGVQSFWAKHKTTPRASYLDNLQSSSATLQIWRSSGMITHERTQQSCSQY